mmetsp:Transcript_24980/g.24441  ORF Transcript_24980/g.24441 Transcript_24980/m.24441 type:complete len:99 (+) Transcript_24980:3-299(+)
MSKGNEAADLLASSLKQMVSTSNSHGENQSTISGPVSTNVKKESEESKGNQSMDKSKEELPKTIHSGEQPPQVKETVKSEPSSSKKPQPDEKIDNYYA